jgi:hypothetical protein
VGQSLAVGWLRLFWGMIKATWSITAGGSMTGMIIGLGALVIVVAIVSIPLIIGTMWWLVAGLIGMFTSARTGETTVGTQEIDS